jgi:parallel beta-helix repeat protein
MNKNVTCAFVPGLLFLLVLGAACLGSNWIVRGASTIIVPDDYSTIQEAINNAGDGDTISVKAGTYYEHVVVNKTISLVGEDNRTTIVDANGTGRGFSISRGYVNITGFTIRKCGSVYAQDAGVWIEGTGHCNIFGNNVTENNFFGISVWGAPSNNITGNIVSKTKVMGIHIKTGSNNIVSGNQIEDYYCGISTHAGSYNNRIVGNSIRQGDCGILLDNSYNSVISGNNITENRWKYGYNLTDEKYGISIQDDSSGNVIFGNYIADNDGNGTQVVTGASGNRLYHNNFINNEKQAYVLAGSTNYWDDDYPSGGNYWSDYNETDVNHDGIGDISYLISTNNLDHYPLMGMFSEFNVSLPYGETENVTAISNSTVANLTLLIWLSSPYEGLQPGQPYIQFFATGENGSGGFCRLMIPRTVLNSSSYIVLVDSNPVNATELPVSNSTHVYLYFAYAHSTREVIVTIPEFVSCLMLSIFMTTTLLATTLCRRKRSPKVN